MKKYIFIFLCLFWMAYIFYNSSRSGYESNFLSFSIVTHVDGSANEQLVYNKNTNGKYNPASTGTNTEQIINTIVRKNAHALEYFVLAVLLTQLFEVYGKLMIKNIINIMFICLVYAVTDEYHQIFVIGRNSSVVDVIIDLIGAAIGLLVIYIFKIITKIKKTTQS